MGMFKWLKKEWSGSRDRRASLPSRFYLSKFRRGSMIPQTENDAGQNNVDVDSNTIRTIEYRRALSQFLERRNTLTPNQTIIETHSSPGKHHKNNGRNNSNKNCNLNDVEQKLNEIDNINKKLDILQQTDVLGKNIKHTIGSPKNVSKSPSDKKTTFNEREIKFPEETINASKSSNENKNTSSSISYDKFSHGDIDSSLNRQLDENKEVNGDKIDDLVMKINTSFNLEKDIHDNESKLSLSPSEYFKTSLENFDETFLVSNKYPDNKTKTKEYKSRAVLNKRFSENDAKYIRETDLEYLENWAQENENRKVSTKYNINYYLRKIQTTNFSFVPFSNFFTNIPLVEYDDLRCDLSYEVGFGEYCEWKLMHWNKMKVVVRRITPNCRIRCEELFATELKILTTLRHPSFLLLLGISHHRIYELLPIYENFRYSLHTHMYKMANAVSLQKALNYTQQICGAVSFLHQFNIIHSAISSHCIVLDNTLEIVKLCGFDSAIIADTIITDSDIKKLIRKQWFQWIAPEFFKEYYYDVNMLADVYSLCLVFLELCMAKEPWEYFSYMQLLNTYVVWKTEVKIPTEIFPRALYNMLTNGLTLEANKRDMTINKMLNIMQSVSADYKNKDEVFVYLELSQTFEQEKENVSNLSGELIEKTKNISPKRKFDKKKSFFQKRVIDKNLPRIRLENKVTFIKKQRSFPSYECYEANLDASDSSLSTARSLTLSIASPDVEKNYVSLPTTPQPFKRFVEEEEDLNLSLPDTPIATNAALRKYKWLSEKDHTTNENDENINEYTGLKKTCKYNKSDSHINNVKGSFENVIAPVIDIKSIVETHETWIRESLKNTQTSSTVSPKRDTAVKPASHRTELIIDPKPILGPPNLTQSRPGSNRHSSRVNSRHHLYASMPTPLRDAVSMKRVLNNEMKNFFESSLWKQEKQKCLSKMKHVPTDKSVLHDIIQKEASSMKKSNEEEISEPKFISVNTQTCKSTETIKNNLEKCTQTCENDDYLFINENDCVDTDTYTYIKNIINEVIDNIIPNKMALGNPSLFENPVMTCTEYNDIYIIYEINKKYIKNNNNGDGDSKCSDKTYDIITSDSDCNIYNKCRNLSCSSPDMNATFDVVFRKDGDQLTKRNARSLEFLGVTKTMQCCDCGSVSVLQMNETQSDTDVLDNITKQKLKRCKGYSKFTSINSTEDIYIDDDIFDDPNAYHIQLSPIQLFNNSFYSLSFNDSSNECLYESAMSNY